MPYTITITNDSPQALAYVEKAKKLDFVKVTEIKKPKKVALSQSLDFTPKEKELQRLEDVLNEIWILFNPRIYKRVKNTL